MSGVISGAIAALIERVIGMAKSVEIQSWKEAVTFRFIPDWIAIGFLWCIAQLPYALLRRFGEGCGVLAYTLARKRCHIVRVNIALCFPEKAPAEREELVKQCIKENIVGVFESAYAWWGKPEILKAQIDVIGQENIQNAMARGKGVLLVGAHYSNLDLGGALISYCVPIDVTYRRHNNPLFDYFIRTRRARFFDHIIERSALRSMLKGLKKGRVLWYAADQDYGTKHSVFAPFFGIEAATLNSTAKLVQMTGAAVVFVGHHRKSDGRFELEFSPILENFPRGDDCTDAALINEGLERQIRKFPEQYMWVHRRFKTQQHEKKGHFYR